MGMITIEEARFDDETDTRKPADVAAVTAWCAKVRVTKTYRVEWYDPEGVRVENQRRFETRKEAVTFAEGVKATGQRDVCLITVEEV